MSPAARRMRARGVVAIPRVAPAPDWIRPARDMRIFAHVRLKCCSDLLTVPMPALTSTPIREAASKARAESGSAAAGRDALDSPRPDFHRFRFVFFQFLGERVDVVSLGIDRIPSTSALYLMTTFMSFDSGSVAVKSPTSGICLDLRLARLWRAFWRARIEQVELLSVRKKRAPIAPTT
jgi:hypothetical protein